MARTLVALLIAWVGCITIWLVVPYNNFWYQNTYISDSFLPEIVIAMLLILVLGINPLLRLAGKRWMLDKHQLALIAGLLLFAAVIPSNGLMRMFPRFVADSNIQFHEGPTRSAIIHEADLPQVLFPDPLPELGEDGKFIAHETPHSEAFVDELPRGASVPWEAWVLPITVWAGLILSMWLMMLGLGGVVFPQWRDRERLPFPLLKVYQAITSSDERDAHAGRTLPALFYSKSFWLAAGVVFLLHGFRGLNIFTEAVPFIPLEWDIGKYYQDTIFRNTTVNFKRQYIYFAIIGVAYFIPNRYAISIWGWVIAYSFYVTLSRAYVPTYQDFQSNHQTFGVLVAMVLWTIWLGRAHWASVGRAMFGRAAKNPESRRDMVAGWMFALGCGGMILWLNWAGVGLWWSLLATGGAAMSTLLMARIVAETGIPIFWLNRFTIAHLNGLLPLAWLSPSILFFAGVFFSILTRGTAVSATVMTTLAVGVDRDSTAARQTRMLLLGMIVLVVGFFVASAVHVHMGYQSSLVDTNGKTGAWRVDVWDRVDIDEYTFFSGDRGHQFLGFSIGTGLLWLCSRFPAWPIHPIGILFCQYSIGFLIWFSILIGWLIKTSVTNLLGAGAYRKMQPLFLGLILGELATIIFWAVVPLVIIAVTGQDPSEVPRYTLIRYP